MMLPACNGTDCSKYPIIARMLKGIVKSLQQSLKVRNKDELIDPVRTVVEYMKATEKVKKSENVITNIVLSPHSLQPTLRDITVHQRHT